MQTASLTMAIVAIFEFPGESVEKYEKTYELGGPGIVNQPSRIHHVCYRMPDGFTVVDVWEDEASFAAFGELICPVLQAAGLDAKPIIHPVQGAISQDGTREY
jgi:hypothetical protein